MIASRINSILGLALDFYSIQQTLSSGGAISSIKARCEKELERIEKQFNDYMAFLLRVYPFLPDLVWFHFFKFHRYAFAYYILVLHLALQILSVKLNVGQFPHLAALVTRINYNCFYMSDGGILMPTPGTNK